MQERSKRQKYRDLLPFVAFATIIVCAVVFFFFRLNVLTSLPARLFGILTPFLYGFAIAYLLRPACLLIEKGLTRLHDRFFHKPHAGLIRTISLLLALALFLVVIVLLLVAVLPELITSISSIANELPKTVERFEEWIASLDQGESTHGIVTNLQQTVDTLSDHLQSYLQSSLLPSMTSLITNVTSSFMNLLSFLKNFGLGCIIASYLMGGWEKFAKQAGLAVYGVFPKKAADWIRREVHYTDAMFNGFIHGKLLDSLIIGILCFIFCVITSMPYAMLISIIVGVTNIIPFFGPYLGAIPSIILVLTISPVKCVIFLVFIILLQQFDGNILGPSILGDRLGISGIWILFSIMLFSSLWGIVGMLIGVPVFAVLYDLARRSIVRALKQRGQQKKLQEYQEQFGE